MRRYVSVVCIQIIGRLKMLRALFALLRLFRDVKAVSRGRTGRRLWNRGVGRAARRFMR